MGKLQLCPGCGRSLLRLPRRLLHKATPPTWRLASPAGWSESHRKSSASRTWFPSLLPYSLALRWLSLMLVSWTGGDATRLWLWEAETLPPSLSCTHLASLWSEDQGPYLLSWYNSTAENPLLSRICPSSEGRPPSLSSSEELPPSSCRQPPSFQSKLHLLLCLPELLILTSSFSW